MRKSIYLTRSINSGEIITEKDLSLKCPYLKNAYNGQNYFDIIGKEIQSSKKKEDPLFINDIN